MVLQNINQKISAGMVQSLMTDFLETEEEESSVDTETHDLNLLIKILNQMNLHARGESFYQSPWSTLFQKESKELESQGYITSDDEHLLFVLLNPKETEGDFTGSKKAIDSIRQIIDDVKIPLPG